MEERPLVEVSLDALKQVFATYDDLRRAKPESFAAVAGLVARLEQELTDSEVRICLTGFSSHVSSTEFAIRIEKVGPGRRWKVADKQSEVFHLDERCAVRLWFELRIEGSAGLQHCAGRCAPWRKVDETGIEALLKEAKRLWKELDMPGEADERWRSDTIDITVD